MKIACVSCAVCGKQGVFYVVHEVELCQECADVYVNCGQPINAEVRIAVINGISARRPTEVKAS